jgi:hypothetical protein
MEGYAQLCISGSAGNARYSAEEHVPTSPRISDLQHRRRRVENPVPGRQPVERRQRDLLADPRVTAWARRSERRVALAELATATQWNRPSGNRSRCPSI